MGKKKSVDDEPFVRDALRAAFPSTQWFVGLYDFWSSEDDRGQRIVILTDDNATEHDPSHGLGRGRESRPGPVLIDEGIHLGVSLQGATFIVETSHGCIHIEMGPRGDEIVKKAPVQFTRYASNGVTDHWYRACAFFSHEEAKAWLDEEMTRLACRRGRKD